jgi:hypothetical protein
MSDSEIARAQADDVEWRLKQLARQMEALRLNFIDPSTERLSRIEQDIRAGFQTISVQLTQINEAIKKIK